MSHSPKAPPLATATSDLPEVEDGVLAYDTTQGKPVARVAGAWSEIAGEVFGTPTVVYDDGAAVGNTDQIQGDIPNLWKKYDASLKGLVIGTSCKVIGDEAFSNSDLTGSLVIPDSVTKIGSLAFSSCSGLTGTLTIPNSVTSIGGGAFSYCFNLIGPLVIPDSVTIIGAGAFATCGSLTGTLTIPNSVTVINNNTFKGCSGLTGSLTIPDSVTSIGTAAFLFCTGFTGPLVIPNSVTSIGESAFRDCTGLTGSLTIPNSVTTIGVFAFEGCSGLTNVDCYVEKSVLDVASSLDSSGVTTIHVRSTDTTWTAGAGQTIGGKTGITVIKDL